MSEPTAHSGKPDHSGVGSSHTRARWPWIVGVVVIVGAISAALWWPSSSTPEATVEATPSDQAMASPSEEPSSSEASSPTPTPTPTPTPSDAPAFTDVNGRWCPTSPADWEESCLTVDLPTVVYDDHPDLAEYVYPSSADTAGDPSTFVYDIAPSLGDCWEAAVDVYPAMSGAAFIFCPGGVPLPTDEDRCLTDILGDATVDRLFITQECDDYPLHRDN